VTAVVASAVFTVPTVVIELTAVEVSAVFPFKPAMPVFVVYPVAVVSMPARVCIVGIAGIVSFKIDLYVYLGAG